MNIRSGDQVVVITGKDKGKTGTVLRTLSSTHRVVVAGINMRTKHVKATPQRAGQRLQYEASLSASNVMLVDPKTKKRTRVGFSVNEKGRKERVAKQSGEVVARGVVKPAAAKDEKGAKKEVEGAKSTKAEKAPKETKKTDVQKVDKPEKKPFWKKVGFGAGDAEETAADEKPAKKEVQDHSVPEQGQTPDTFNHQRGK